MQHARVTSHKFILQVLMFPATSMSSPCVFQSRSMYDINWSRSSIGGWRKHMTLPAMISKTWRNDQNRARGGASKGRGWDFELPEDEMLSHLCAKQSRDFLDKVCSLSPCPVSSLRPSSAPFTSPTPWAQADMTVSVASMHHRWG